ncbi:hypothetical protein LZ554_000387 [Drepanopeziza brunnea f. sp. 'monogermtubi']|nr:hypothetical protein LZ554_000387 [Drepanopeziza brunnea f. sp. 'monogermtubi']
MFSEHRLRSFLSLGYNNITHMGAHNSAFLRDSSTSYSTSGNQYYNATVALSAGIRLLQAQVHNESGILTLCHSSCNLLNAGTLESWLSNIKFWMDANPNEVVTILLVNSDDQQASAFGTVFQSSGMADYGYTPSSTSAMSTWPTLQTLIDNNTRLVTFIASIDYDSAYPYLLPEFTYVFENYFDVTSVSGFNCSIERPTALADGTGAGAVSSGYLGLMNNFLYTSSGFGISIPAVSLIESTNSPSTTGGSGTLGNNAARCQSEWAGKPTFILVDFFNVGPAIAAADNLNGITATGRTDLSTALLTAGSENAGARRGVNSCFGVAAVVLGVLAVGNFVWL